MPPQPRYDSFELMALSKRGEYRSYKEQLLRYFKSLWCKILALLHFAKIRGQGSSTKDNRFKSCSRKPKLSSLSNR